MGDERDRDLREDWADHPQSAFLGAGADIFSTRAGKGPETPEERAAREGAPEVEGPSLDELIAKEKGPVIDFTRGAREVHEEHDGEGADPPS
jgi:hypothetical protein